jgi:hypothetical protein
MMMHLLNEDDDCRHDISRSKGSEPAAAVAVPPDHLDEDEPPVAVQGSSTEPAGATTAEDSSPATTDSSSCTAESSSPSASGDSSCSGGWWESGNSWGWGDSSYSGSEGISPEILLTNSSRCYIFTERTSYTHGDLVQVSLSMQIVESVR